MDTNIFINHAKSIIHRGPYRVLREDAEDAEFLRNLCVLRVLCGENYFIAVIRVISGFFLHYSRKMRTRRLGSLPYECDTSWALRAMSCWMRRMAADAGGRSTQRWPFKTESMAPWVGGARASSLQDLLRAKKACRSPLPQMGWS